MSRVWKIVSVVHEDIKVCSLNIHGIYIRMYLKEPILCYSRYIRMYVDGCRGEVDALALQNVLFSPYNTVAATYICIISGSHTS